MDFFYRFVHKEEFVKAQNGKLITAFQIILILTGIVPVTNVSILTEESFNNWRESW